MFNRAVTAFRKSVQKSRSSTNLESDGDDVHSVASSVSAYSIATSNTSNDGHSDISSNVGSGFRRRFRRSRSTNREGDFISVSCSSFGNYVIFCGFISL